MAAFQTQIDIGSRALQHIGSSRMDPVLGFNDTAVRGAPEAGFAYDKVREAVLQENVWTCAVRRTVLRPVDANTMLLAPALWTSGTTYFIGSIVTDQSGNMWISNIPNNLANDPLLSNFWDPYFGPMTASLYDTATAYFSGELVYTTSGDGKNRCYLSLQNGNSDNPGIATAWSATTTYFKNQVVTYLSIAYMSLIDLNTNNTPSASPALFNIATTYAIGNTVGASDGVIYTSLSNGNVGNDPTLDGGVHWSSGGVLNKWTTVFVGGVGSDKWIEIGGTEFPSGVALTPLVLVYPIGSGPSTQQASRNAYRLPANYLSPASQNPKGTTPWLGGPTGNTFNDWNYENGFLVTAQGTPISFRFVANLTDVRRMAPLFCEGLAARIGRDLCDIITQDKGQWQILDKLYKDLIGIARIRNAIEQGYDDPPDDDFISVRY